MTLNPRYSQHGTSKQIARTNQIFDNPDRAHWHILIVHDDQAQRESLAALLRAAGHHVIEAESVSGGRVLLRNHECGLVFVDLDCPQAAGEIRMASPGATVIGSRGFVRRAMLTIGRLS